MPKPLQSGQYPVGELNENNLGSTLGTEKPHLGQVKYARESFLLMLRLLMYFATILVRVCRIGGQICHFKLLLTTKQKPTRIL